jgi:hypothetical protein
VLRLCATLAFDPDKSTWLRSARRNLARCVRLPKLHTRKHIGLPESLTNLRNQMIAETNLTEERRRRRVVFTPLKPKRRFKFDELPPVSVSEDVCPAPVRLGRHRVRIRRSGRAHVQWRRVTPPSELLETMPKHSRSPVLARVTDKVKGPGTSQGQWQGFRALLRELALELR